jgi:hypothetical protein
VKPRVDFAGPGRLAVSNAESFLIATTGREPTFGAHPACRDRRALGRSNEAALTMDADRSAFFIALVVVDVFIALADAISGPYTVLFLVDQGASAPFP